MSTTIDEERDLFPLNSRAFLEDPYPFYARLRHEAPVYKSSIGVFTVARHADVHALLTSPQFVKSGNVPPWAVDSPSTARFLSLDMAFQSREEHQRIRRAVNAHFTRGALARLTDRMEEIIRADLERIAGESSFDVVEDFGSRFPVTVAGELVGIDPHDQETLYAACERMGSFIEPAPSEADIVAMERGFATMMTYAVELVVERRLHSREDDLLSLLVSADLPEEKRLSDDELAALVTALFLGGFETTRGTVTNGIRALAQFPDQHRLLRERPDLASNATEEILRWDASLQLEPRKALETVTIADRSFEPETQFLAIIGSANRDETHHEEPDAFIIERPHDQRSHFAFGGGAYYCLGAAFARMEVEIVFRLLPACFKRIELVEIDFGTRPALRSPERMLVAVSN
jgi:cytochrome P450